MRKYPTRLPYGLEYIDRNTVRKNGIFSLKNNRYFMEVLCNHLIHNPDPMVVPVLDFKMGSVKNGEYYYSYDMKALLDLYTEEKRIVNWVADHYEEEGLPSQSVDAYIQQGWLEWPELMQFLEQWIAMQRHRDIHDGNIMIDEEGSYRLIDLEAFIHSPLDAPINNWITR